MRQTGRERRSERKKERERERERVRERENSMRKPLGQETWTGAIFSSNIYFLVYLVFSHLAEALIQIDWQ